MNVFHRARSLAHARLKDAYQRKEPHTPEKTLVIVDMQSGFMHSGEDKIVPAICSLISHARQKEWAIIVVEFDNNGETDDEILNALDGYPHWTTVAKGGCDGGMQVIKSIEKYPSWSLNIVVCGIYGPQCVAATVSGILDNSDLTEVEIVTDAVYPKYRSYRNYKDSEPEWLRERKITVGDVVDCNSPVSV